MMIEGTIELFLFYVILRYCKWCVWLILVVGIVVVGIVVVNYFMASGYLCLWL
jgi:hypothetical protein